MNPACFVCRSQFAAWKGEDAATLESELIRVAAALETSAHRKLLQSRASRRGGNSSNGAEASRQARAGRDLQAVLDQVCTARLRMHALTKMACMSYVPHASRHAVEYYVSITHLLTWLGAFLPCHFRWWVMTTSCCRFSSLTPSACSPVVFAGALDSCSPSRSPTFAASLFPVVSGGS